jgi:hypothetical protein
MAAVSCGEDAIRYTACDDIDAPKAEPWLAPSLVLRQPFGEWRRRKSMEPIPRGCNAGSLVLAFLVFVLPTEIDLEKAIFLSLA